MQTIVFVLSCVAIYFASDWVLGKTERLRGKQFEQRELIFFFILLGLGLAVFYLVRLVVPV